MKTNNLFTALVFLVLASPLAQMVLPVVPVPFLHGVQNPEPPPVLAWGNITDRSFQNGAEAWFNQNYGLHADGVKTYRQIYHSLFGGFQNKEGIILGKNGQLLSDPYIKRTLQFNPPAHFEKVVERLVRINRLLHSRGKTFVLLITPSKSTTYPGGIPDAYGRFPHYPPGADYRSFVGLVRQAGLPCVDAKKLIQDAAAAAPHPFFPRDGIHWTDQGAALAAQAFLKGIERASGKAIGRVKMDSIRYDQTPSPRDEDYSLLLNVWNPPRNPEGVHVDASAVRGEYFGKLSILVEGGSFAEKVLEIYSGLGIFKSVSAIAYNHSLVHYAAGYPGKPLEPWDWDRDVLPNDIVAVEINDPLIATGDPDLFSSGFLRDLLERLEKAKQP